MKALRLYALIGLALPHMAMAINEEACRVYSQTAVSDAATYTAARCGQLDRGRWQTDTVAHSSWCAGARRSSVQDEAVARFATLNQCNHEAACRSYAANAKAAISMNQRFQCMQNGGARFDPNADHFGWCMKASANSVMEAIRARYADVDHCGTCERYAQDAVRAAQLCKSNPGGPRWDTNPANHVRWCWSAKADSLRAEANARQQALPGCK